jgi:hypothetical protein
VEIPRHTTPSTAKTKYIALMYMSVVLVYGIFNVFALMAALDTVYTQNIALKEVLIFMFGSLIVLMGVMRMIVREM